MRGASAIGEPPRVSGTAVQYMPCRTSCSRLPSAQGRRPRRDRSGATAPNRSEGYDQPPGAGARMGCMSNPEQYEVLDEDWQHVSAVVAHPDDPEYGAAAAVARWTLQGKQVTSRRGEACSTRCAMRPTGGSSRRTVSVRGAVSGRCGRSARRRVLTLWTSLTASTSGLPRCRAHEAYIEDLGRSDFDPRKLLEAGARAAGTRLGTTFAAAVEAFRF